MGDTGAEPALFRKEEGVLMKGPPSLNPFNSPGNAREVILQILCDRESASSRKLFFAVRRAGFSMSMQGFYKHLNMLLEDGQVIKPERNRYRLNPEWIRALRAFCDIAERSACDDSAAGDAP